MNRPCILLVEDDDNDVFFLKLAFDTVEVDCTLQVAHDGEEAIDYLAGRKEFADRDRHPFPSLVLLDLKLPVKSGFNVLEWIRHEPVCKKTIVIVLSASAQPSDIDRAYELGANSYLVKPADIRKREHMVRLIKDYWLNTSYSPSFPED